MQGYTQTKAKGATVTAWQGALAAAIATIGTSAGGAGFQTGEATDFVALALAVVVPAIHSFVRSGWLTRKQGTQLTNFAENIGSHFVTLDPSDHNKGG